ncbi:MAG: glycosyltransferase family 4 protein [Thermaerobacter sp.]|nr:glycosyltransferase family 4 protein [Bacillota bacterium]REJ38232.1 MAG: glycosyltransferase family 4 protein [Bacillota bacterium]
MRIGIFTDSYTPYVSGVVRSIVTLRDILESQGHEVYVFAPAYPHGCGADDARVFRYPSVAAPSYRDFRIPLPVWSRVRRDAGDLGLQVIHAHSPFIMGRLGMRLARSLGVPFCLTYHTLYDAYLERYAAGFSTLLLPALHAYLQSFCNRTDVILTPTYAVYRQLRRMGVRSRLEVVPTGIDLRRFQAGSRAQGRRRLGLPGDVPLLVYVGRLSVEKNLPLLLDAFRRVAAARLDVHMVMVGDGPLRAHLEAQTLERPLRGRLHLTGPLEPEAVADVLAAGDLFAFASVTETQGLVLVEAMAAGLPVVCVRSSATSEVVREGVDGLVVDNDAGAVAEALLRMLADPDARVRASRAARERARMFSVDRMARQMLDLYRRLAGVPPVARVS